MPTETGVSSSSKPLTVAIEVKGISEFQKELKRLAPDLYKEMKMTWKTVLGGLVKKAKGFIPSDAPLGLESWSLESKRKHKSKYQPFPMWDASKAKSGITYRTTKSKVNAAGFVNYMRIRNKSAVGAIYETAGRADRNKSKHGYRSDNPQAGEHFKRRIQNSNLLAHAGEMKTNRKMWGRVIFKAWAQDEGKAIAEIVASIERAKYKLESRMANAKKEVIK